MGRYRISGAVVECERRDGWQVIGGVAEDGIVVLRADMFAVAVLGEVIFTDAGEFRRTVENRGRVFVEDP